MTYHEKLEALRQEMIRMHTALNAVTSELNDTWDALRGARSEMGKITKDVATLKSLWSQAPKKYSRAG